MLGKWVAVIGMLTFGTVSSVMSKINFEVRGINTLGKEVPFHKPWFCVLVMFVGMSGCMLLYLGSYAAGLFQRCRRKGARKGREYADDPSLGGESNAYLQALLDGEGEKGNAPPEQSRCASFLQVLMIAIPTSFDLIATVLMSIGLLYVTVSIYQMMRGAELIFAAIFSVLFLGKKLYRLHYVGIALALVGITMVGAASIMAPEQNDTGTKAQQILGIVLIVFSQAIQAGQICFEEHFMKQMDFMKPTLVVGLEGLFGCILQMAIVLPLAQALPGDDVGHKLENTTDTLHMIFDSPDHVVLYTLVFTAFVMLFYNILGMSVTSHWGALFRSILETTRTLFAWIAGLLMYYLNVKLYGEPLGESWNKYSYLQLAGFCVLVSGTLIYGRGDEKRAEKEEQEYYESIRDQEGMGGAGDPRTQAINIGGGAMPAGVDNAMPSSFTPSSAARRNAYYDFASAAGSYGSLSRSALRNSVQ